MIVRILVLIVGVLEVVMPRRFVDFWMNRAVTDADEVELRPWVYTVARLEGVVLVAWALYQFQSSRTEGRSSAGPVDAPSGEQSGITAAVGRESTQSVSTNGQDQTIEPPAAEDTAVTITPGTRKHVLASSLYYADEPMTVNELVDAFAGSEDAMTSSNISAALYTMHQDDIVHRRKRGGDGSFEYWLTDAAIRVLEALDEPIEPNPFPTK